MGHESVAIDGQPIPSVEVARQGGDVIVFSGSEAGLLGSIERDNGAGFFYTVHHRPPLRVLFDTRRTCQRVAVDTLQFHLCYPRKLEIELYAAANCGIALISAAFVCLDCRNHHRISIAVPLCGRGGNRHNGDSH